MDFSLAHRASKLYDLPGFVKQARHVEPNELATLDAECFLDPVRRQYPVHTKSACYLSNVQYWENALFEQAPNLPLAQGLLKAAAAYGIRKEVKDLIEKIAASHSVYTSELPDSSYALVTSMDGTLHRQWPLLDAQTVQLAAEGLHKNRHSLPYALRKQAATRILEKAAKLNVASHGDTTRGESSPWWYLEKAAGHGHVSSGRLSDAFKIRGLYMLGRDKQAADKLEQLGNTIRSTYQFGNVPTEAIEKSAQLLDTVDRQTGLYREYSKGLMLPEEQIYDLVEHHVKRAGLHTSRIRLTTGDYVDADDLQRAGVGAFRVLPEYLSSVAPHGSLDMAKAASVLPTLPRDDAKLFLVALQAEKKAHATTA